jgi:phage tail-like protein
VRAQAIAELLPEVFRRGRHPDGVLQVTLEVMELLHGPVENILTNFDTFVDPYRCPARFVPYLASWVALGWLVEGRQDGDGLSTGDGPLRDLIAEAETLAKLRGTRAGLQRFLRLATACEEVQVVEPDDTPFHIRVMAPASLRAHAKLLETILLHEKPAFTTAELAIGDDAPRRFGRLAPEPRPGPPGSIPVVERPVADADTEWPAPRANPPTTDHEEGPDV